MQASDTIRFMTFLVIALCCIAPAIRGVNTQNADPVGGIPSNETLFFTAAVHGTSAPLSSFETQEEVTIFRVELNRTTFPGPRSMAFGPRYIQLTASPASLIVLIIGFLAGGVALFIVYKRKKAGQSDGISTEEEEEAKDDREKRE